MDVDLDDGFINNQYSYLFNSLFVDNSPKPHTFIKQTLINSPTITNILSNVKVKINKAFKGSSSVLLNDDEYQVLIPPEEDSQMDIFDDNDDDIFDDRNEISSTTTKPQLEKSIFEKIQVLVKKSSISVNGIEYNLKSTVRSSCLIRASIAQEEDHILIALKSGFLILLRIYKVPYYVKDTDYDFKNESPANSIFKPFLIQWWNFQQELNFPELHTSGYSLISSPSGLSTVSSSASRSLRLYPTLQQSQNGAVLKNHLSIPLDGFLVDSCFIEPNSTMQTDMLLTLVFTEHRRLYINLYSWSCLDDLSSGLTKTSFPLENTFHIPIFVVPLSISSAFLFVSQSMLTIVSIHDILSAQYDFKRTDAPWTSFPTSYYIPQAKFTDLDVSEIDEILISTDSGVIYSVLITKEGVSSITPVIRVTDSLSLFTLEKTTNGHELNYSSTTGSNKSIVIPNRFSKEYLCDIENDSKLGFSKFELVENLENWAPIQDIIAVASSANNNSFDELWAITGVGNKKKLTNFKTGYRGTRQSEIYEELRKVINSWIFSFNERVLIICSLPLETKLLEIEDKDYEEDLFAVENPVIHEKESTIYCTKFDIVVDNEVESLLIQVTNHSITITDLNFKISQSYYFFLTFATYIDNKLYVIGDEDGEIRLTIYQISCDALDEDTVFEDYAKVKYSEEVDFQPSMLKTCQINNENVLIIGTFEYKIYFYEAVNDFIRIKEILNLSSYKTDLDDNDIKLVPKDCICVDDELFVGTYEGYFIRISFKSGIEFKSFYKVGSGEVQISKSEDNGFIFIQCRDLYMIDLHGSSYPQKVQFNDTLLRTVNSLVEFPNSESSMYKKVGLFKSNGFVIAHVNSYPKPFIRQVSIDEASQKLQYFRPISAFIILGESKKICCIDKITLKPFNITEFKNKNKVGSIFNTNEFPISSCIWKIQRNGRTSYKLLLGCSVKTQDKVAGSIKVLDFRKPKDQNSTINITELTTFDHSEPVTHIQQLDDRIFFTSQSTIWMTSYHEQDKKFVPIKKYSQFPSDIISFSAHKNKILACTQSDSNYQYIITDDLDYTININGEPQKMLFEFNSKPILTIDQVNYKNQILMSSKRNSLVHIVDGIGDQVSIDFNESLKVQLPGISKFITAKLDNPWMKDQGKDDEDTILCVSKSGDIIALRSVDKSSNEISDLVKNLNSNNKSNVNQNLSLTDQLNRLNNPFTNKLSGTGLLSINKPMFDDSINRLLSSNTNDENVPDLLDFDLEEISKNFISKISLQ
ncbi:hypothetical protein KGF54_004074 [Candida jiufengensis]|uniref:uncharacterized protein n=1 Tax=Candida jiufengensis TaxID=497108 RepID=UPI0022252B4B|nr:uncharacterized protein KGF54_004074 [Candida jiufengensis]KAI5951000.1 hypothetical protein KGF54_004074 [Candida jiufengensis]